MSWSMQQRRPLQMGFMVYHLWDVARIGIMIRKRENASAQRIFELGSLVPIGDSEAGLITSRYRAVLKSESGA
jgi:hypothetical protein